MKVLILGGTTEGRILARGLSELGHRVTVSVATPLGAEELEGMEGLELWMGRKDEEALEQAVGAFDRCVDATHPYALLASANIRCACGKAGVPLLRLLRPESRAEGVLWADSCPEAARLLAGREGNILLTTGAKELGAFGALPKERLFVRVLPCRESLEAYKPTVADPVKSGFNREGFEANKKELLGLWIRWGLEHPLTYINSFLIGTVDFWYPGAVMDGYKDPYGRSSYFDYRVAQPGEEIVLLPGLHDFYERLSWDKEAQQKPLAFSVLSPGWYFLVFLVVFMYLWCYKKRGLLVPLLIPLLNMATVLLGPMALVRYVLILFYAFPLLLALFFKSDAFGR